MLATVLVFGMAVVSCDDGSTNENDNTQVGGVFTLTGIPSEYNGWYAFIEGDTSYGFYGFQNFNMETLEVKYAPIVNGRVNVPMWIVLFNETTGEVPTVKRYSGNDTFDVDMGIWNSENDDIEDNISIGIYFESVIFKNGNAIKSWNDGTVYE